MVNIKLFLKKNFHYFHYFYRYLGHRIYMGFGLSLLVGLLDGIGLALFIPLLKTLSEDPNSSPSNENLDFISNFVINQLQITPTLLNIFLLVFFFFSLKGIAKFFESYLRTSFQQYFIKKIRISNIDLFNNYDFQKFLQVDKGRLQNSFSGEVDRVHLAYKYYFRCIHYTILFLVYVILAIVSDWKFTSLVMIGGILVSSVFKFLYKRTKAFSKEFTLRSHIFQNLMVQMVHLFQYLKATNLHKNYGKKLKVTVEKMESEKKKIGMVDALLSAIREPITILMVFLAVFINIYLFGELVSGILLSLILIYRSLTFYMASQEEWNFFLGVSGSLDNMRSIEEELKIGKEINGNLILKSFENSIEFENMSFRFNSGDYVLQNINLEVKKNETIALVGESGAGKSTLLNIATGLLKPTKGNYLIDGHSIQNLDSGSFKNRVGYVVQDATIFNDSIYNNVTFWAAKSKDNCERFLEAVEKASISNFIRELPEKEETILGNNGMNISGGQRQRLAIARELFKKVDILLMDEATSSLDGGTEALIQDNLKKLQGQYTILIIAHRLSTIEFADKVVLMKKGSILTSGSFQQLKENSEEFRKMISQQKL